MEYIIILEHNHKENDTFVFYCQWTGNEVELEKLINIIKTASSDGMYGDYASFSTSRVKIPETAVDIHCSINEFGNYMKMFQKCKGTFTCPEFSEDKYELAIQLDKYFNHGRLYNNFK
jgi:hypothetical protein